VKKRALKVTRARSPRPSNADLRETSAKAFEELVRRAFQSDIDALESLVDLTVSNIVNISSLEGGAPGGGDGGHFEEARALAAKRNYWPVLLTRHPDHLRRKIKTLADLGFWNEGEIRIITSGRYWSERNLANARVQLALRLGQATKQAGFQAYWRHLMQEHNGHPELDTFIRDGIETGLRRLGLPRRYHSFNRKQAKLPPKARRSPNSSDSSQSDIKDGIRVALQAAWKRVTK
jgi:hypothetical protein